VQSTAHERDFEQDTRGNADLCRWFQVDFIGPACLCLAFAVLVMTKGYSLGMAVFITAVGSVPFGIAGGLQGLETLPKLVGLLKRGIRKWKRRIRAAEAR
jgi:hypothetical protein